MGQNAYNYKYDPIGDRIQSAVALSSGQAETNTYAANGLNQYTKIINSQLSITNSYTWGLDLSGTLQGAGDVGCLLSQTIITPTTASSYFPLADANGNAVTYIDDAGNVQAHYTYDAFGNTVFQAGAMADDFRFRFSSKYLDDETGLYFSGYRWYSPELGRWLSRDPIEERGEINVIETGLSHAPV